MGARSAAGRTSGTTLPGPRRPLLVAVGGRSAAKLQRPEVPPSSVPRHRLIADLDAAAAGTVTVVNAGPGWGKTQLVASWAAASQARPVAWLTLDAEDNEPRLFWTHLVAALRASGAVPGHNALATVDPRHGITVGVQRQVADGLADLPGRVALVLDDSHEITNPEIGRQLAEATGLGPQLTLVVATRAEAFLPVHRLRIEGKLSEIGAERLAFDADEAAALLAQHGHVLDDRGIGLLLDRTQGWAAGLRLAALFLTRHGPNARPEDFRGSHGPVAEYLLREVLDGQPQPMQRFLLRTSIADRLCADLADTLTGESHGQAYLERLERGNTFVTALGPARTWFRYHPLLAEMLRDRLTSMEPATLPTLHERAARWFVDHGEPIPAMQHAAASADWALVGRVFTTAAAPRMVSAERSALHAVLAGIPAAAEAGSSDLHLCAAGRLVVEERYDEIQPHLVAARSALAPGSPGPGAIGEVLLEMFEIALARIRGDSAALVTATTNALRLLDRDGSEAPAAQDYRAIALGNRGVGLFWVGRFGAAEQCFLAAAEPVDGIGLELARVNVLSHLALLEALVGRLRDAKQQADSAVALAERRGWTTLPQAAPAYLALALVALEHHNLAAADRELRLSRGAHSAQPEVLMVHAQQLVQAWLHLTRGHGWAARRDTTEVREAWSGREPPALLAQWLQATELEAGLLTGDGESIRRRLQRGDLESTLSDRERLYLAKVHLASGGARDARRLLEPIREPGPDRRLVVEARLLAALAADRLREDRRAVDSVREAMTFAEEEGIVRPFRTLDPSRLRSLVETVTSLHPSHRDFAERLLAGSRAPGSVDGVGAVEPLSERELTVLLYLEGMLSNAEIAERMFVSQNTVKVHLKHLYRKLGVGDRRAAVQRARRLGLTDRVDD